MAEIVVPITAAIWGYLAFMAGFQYGLKVCRNDCRKSGDKVRRLTWRDWLFIDTSVE